MLAFNINTNYFFVYKSIFVLLISYLSYFTQHKTPKIIKYFIYYLCEQDFPYYKLNWKNNSSGVLHPVTKIVYLFI